MIIPYYIYQRKIPKKNDSIYFILYYQHSKLTSLNDFDGHKVYGKTKQDFINNLIFSCSVSKIKDVHVK